MLGLIWVKTVFKSYQQTTLVGIKLRSIEGIIFMDVSVISLLLYSYNFFNKFMTLKTEFYDLNFDRFYSKTCFFLAQCHAKIVSSNVTLCSDSMQRHLRKNIATSNKRAKVALTCSPVLCAPVI